MFGNGIYTAMDFEIAKEYAQNGLILMMALDKNSKIFTIKKQIDIFQELVKEIKKYNVLSKTEKIILQDLGRLKAIEGFDAIYVSSKNYYIVLNRGKLFIEE